LIDADLSPKLTVLVEGSSEMMIHFLEFIGGEECGIRDEFDRWTFGLVVSEPGYDRRRAPRHHRVCESDQVTLESRRFAFRLPAVDVILDDCIGWLDEKMRPAAWPGQHGRAGLPLPLVWVHRERG
jgi:hypothetical protein